MKRRLTQLLSCLTFVGLPLATTTMNVGAQGVTEEVVVTARQREESITDVPASITAFSSETIERAGIERAEDFISLTPGVTMVDSAEVGDTQVSIRGINGARDGEANFAFIVDGILHTNPSAFNREFADLKQIEILKGPQGALYGRSAASGAIIVTTNDPTNEFSGEFKASAGSQDTYHLSGAVSGALIQDQLFGRLHFDYRDTDGFFKNNFLNNAKNVDNAENWNVNGRILWEPTEDLTVDMKGHYGEVDAAAISFNAAFAIPVAPAGSPLFADVNDHNFLFQANRDPSNDQESKDFSIKLDYDMDWATVTGWFLYSDIEQAFLADGTSGAFGFYNTEPSCIASTAALFANGTRLPAPTALGATPGASFLGPYTPTTCDGYQYQVRNQDDISFEFRLTSRGDQRLRWQVGMYYLDLSREVGVAQLTDDGRATLPESLVNPLTEALVSDEFNTEVWAGFANVQYDVTENFEASFAIRYDSESREAKSKVPSPTQQTSRFIDYTNAATGGCNDGVQGSPLNVAFITNLGAAGAACNFTNTIPERDEVFDEFQPRVALRWNISDDFTTFASWSRGFKSGGFNNLGSGATVDFFFNQPASIQAGLSISDKFEKETSDVFEIGFKQSIAGGRVSLEGAVFHTTVDDMQFFNFFVGPFGLLRVVSNIDEVTIKGVELGARIDLTDQIDIFGGISWLDGEIDKNRNRPYTEGNEVPYAPEYTLNLGAEFVEPNAIMGADFVLRGDYNVVGPTWFSTVQENRTNGLFSAGFGPNDWSLSKRDSYGIVNIRGGLEKDGWGAHFFVRNLLDEQYLEEVIPAPEFGGSFIHPGNNRSWGAEVSYKF
jgi:iron complex outermembrane recepter protein